MRIDQIASTVHPARASKAAQTDGADFGEMLMDVLKEVNQAQNESRATQNAFMTGQPGVEYHDLMIAMERASVAMQLTLQVRNKVLEAYQEINKMQI